jgi:kynurenine formamidase
MERRTQMATVDQYRKVGAQISNWGRWGADDQLGTLNLITEAKIREAAACVRSGRVFPLGANFDADLVWPAGMFRRNPIHLMTVDGGDAATLSEYLPGYGGPDEKQFVKMWETPFRFADDMIVMSLQCGTQWDALSHTWYDDRLYNDVAPAAITSRGATRNSIDKVDVKGIVSRGVLIDAARERGLDHLPPNTPIWPADLDRIVAAQDVEIRSGDIVLVRTGWWPQFAVTGDGAAWRAGCPGLSWTCAKWLHEHEISAVAADNVALECAERAVDGMMLPLHGLCLRDMGLMLGEMWNLEALAADCAADRIYEFELVAPPLRVTGAVGSPVNPLAIK